MRDCCGQSLRLSARLSSGTGSCVHTCTYSCTKPHTRKQHCYFLKNVFKNDAYIYLLLKAFKNRVYGGSTCVSRGNTEVYRRASDARELESQVAVSHLTGFWGRNRKCSSPLSHLPSPTAMTLEDATSLSLILE